MNSSEENVSSTTRDDWDRHWDDYSQCAHANPALEYRRRVIFSLLNLRNSGSGVRLLDIGSGQGDMAAAVRARFPSAQLLGLELSQSGVEISRQKVPEARFVQRNLLEKVEVPEDQRGWATHAVCSEVIEHVDDPRQLLESARDYMSSGCLLVVTVPGGPMSSFDRYIGHRKHYKSSDIGTLFREVGYETEQISRAGFPFFNLYRWLVVLRGDKIIRDATARQNRPASLSARVAMGIFAPLFHLNFDSSPWGWQMVGTARVPKLSEQSTPQETIPLEPGAKQP
jgi:ubiquinone/menaquinone biosynthesis C-methylase UbiE